jgi:hypothetical protein
MRDDRHISFKNFRAKNNVPNLLFLCAAFYFNGFPVFYDVKRYDSAYFMLIISKRAYVFFFGGEALIYSPTRGKNCASNC